MVGPTGRFHMKILYVEDNPLVREVTAELLYQENRQITSCETAEEALNEFRTSDYDLIITDVSLPVMSGLDLTRRLLQVKPTLPIIIASGYAMECAIDRMGPSVRSIIKPFDAGEISRLIEELTRGNA
jgi:two-component system cell cycle response regulator CpdR